MNTNKPKNPKRVAAGKRNGRLRRPWNESDRQRLREQCLADRPWLHSTGPRTDEGKLVSAANGLRVRAEPGSLRSLRRELADVGAMVMEMRSWRQSLPGIGQC